MYPSQLSQLSYLQTAPLQYTYPNYCMLPPVYNSMLANSPNTVLPTTSTNSPEDSRECRDNLMVTSSNVSSLPDTNLSVGEAGVCEAGDDRTEYMEELSRESLEQTESSHAKRLLDREISLLQSGQAQAPTNC